MVDKDIKLYHYIAHNGHVYDYVGEYINFQKFLQDYGYKNA